jgi:hypothetical protein
MNFSLPKRRKRERFNNREEQQIRCDGHLQWVRGHCCSVGGASGNGCDGRIEAAHVRIGGQAGISQKPGDDRTIPLCTGHHGEQHQIGETSFERKHGIDMAKIAAALWQQSPHRLKYERSREQPK